MKTVGIDIGTTTISAVILESELGEVLASRTIQNGSFIHTENEWERIQDVNIILSKATAVLDEFLRLYPDISSIGLTGQMHGILYTDASGDAVSPLYTWQDARGNLAEFDGKSITDLIKENCGIPAAAGYGLITHAYECRKKRVPENAAALCTIPDYLGMKLTGRKTPLLHVSMAASLGFYNAEKRAFDEENLRRMGADTSILPEITGEFAILGAYNNIPVTVAVGDNQASFLGSVGMRENTVLLNMGTGGQISVLSDTYFEAPGIEARPLTGDTFILVGASLCGGRAYAILETFFRNYIAAAGGEAASQYEIMEKLARRGNNSRNGLKVATTFNGTRVDPDLRGSITNVSEDNFTPANLVLGVLKGMAQELYDMFQLIQKGTKIRAEKLIASGNGVRKNEILRQIFASMFKAELQLAHYEEEAACGAAISSTMFHQ